MSYLTTSQKVFEGVSCGMDYINTHYFLAICRHIIITTLIQWLEHLPRRLRPFHSKLAFTSVSTEHRESRRATQLHNILQWQNYRSLLGDGRHTFTISTDGRGQHQVSSTLDECSKYWTRQTKRRITTTCEMLLPEKTNKPLKKHWFHTGTES